jgi:hypothetical protein
VGLFFEQQGWKLENIPLFGGESRFFTNSEKRVEKEEY